MRRPRSERGAYAVLYSLLTVLMLGVAALAVDIGNATARKSDVQAQADFAALAAASKLTSPIMSGAVPTDAVLEARDYLNKNHPLNATLTCPGDAGCVTDSQLTDGNLTNGEVRFANGGLQVIGAPNRVTFGFANVFGISDLDVQADATVGLASIGKAEMPFYTVNPCDYGTQIMSNNTNGQSTPFVPVLQYPIDFNDTTTVSVSPNQFAVNQAPLPTMTLVAKHYSTTIEVGFFPTDPTMPYVPATSFTDQETPPVTHPLADPGATPPVAAVPYSTQGQTDKSVTFEVPAAVLASEQVWYVRVYNRDLQKWSAAAQAPAFRVGSPPLTCTGGSTTGNFGSIFLDRVSGGGVSVDEQLALNITAGLKQPLSLDVHHSPAVNGVCTAGMSYTPNINDPAVVSDLPNPGLFPDTNCVGTDTGLSAQAATMGFITGVSEGGTPYKGVLHTNSTTPGCAPGGGSGTMNVTLGNGAGQQTYKLNNDTLTCYLTNTTTSLWDIARSSYTGGEVLSPEIFKSPRFFLVPVFKAVPSGSSVNMSIVEMRPAFLTDEAALQTTVKGTNTASANNGLTIVNDELRELKVLYFHHSALPPPPDDAPLGTWFGIGTPVKQMID